MDNNNDHVLQTIHTIAAPVALVWQLWTQPEHIAHWWGPAGFTATIHTMDVLPGGEWKLTLHGPDGTNYPNRSIYADIVPMQKIEFEHFNPHFFTTVLFEPVGDATRINWSLLFDTPEMRDLIVKVHKADEGQRQNIEPLKTYVAQLMGT